MTDSVQTIGGIYDALAEEYERAVVPVFRPLAKRMLQLIDLRPGWQVLDAGTGTGLLALSAAPRVGKTGKIIGVDASAEMVKIARAKAARFGFSQCEFRVGDVARLDCADAQFNVALAQFALHQNDLAPVLQELARVLLPGGTLVIQEWAESVNSPHAVIFETLQMYRVAEPNPGLADARTQSQQTSEFRRTYGQAEVMAAALRAAGFSAVDARTETHPMRVANVDLFIASAAAAPLLSAELQGMTEPVRAAWLNETRSRLRSFETANGFEWKYDLVAVVARK